MPGPQGYTGHIDPKPRLGGRTPPPPPRGGNTGKPGLSIEQWAQKQVGSMVAAQIKAIEDQKNAYLLEQARLQEMQIQRARGLSQGLEGLNSGAYLQNTFGAAADQASGFGKGFGNAVNVGADASAGEQNRMLSGSGQEARNEGDGMSAVMGGVGQIQGSELQKIGSAYAADANRQPAFALEEGILNALRDYKPDTSGFYEDIAKVNASKPEMMLDLMKQRQSIVDAKLKRKWAIQDRKADAKDRRIQNAIDVAEAKRDEYLDLAELEMKQGNFDRANQYLYLAQVSAQNSLDKEYRYQQKDKGLDVDGNPLPGYTRGKNGRVVKVASPSSSSSKSFDWGRLQQDMADEDLTFEGEDPKKPWLGNTEQPMPYHQAFETLFVKYSGSVRDKQRLRRLIAKILKSKGIKKPPSTKWTGAPGQVPPGYEH